MCVGASPSGDRAASLDLRPMFASLIGSSCSIPPDVLAAYPELRVVRWRQGGLALRVGGWCLGLPTVAAITLWDTIWLADPHAADPELLLHELRHVHQFQGDRAFPLRYLWRTLRDGYWNNPYEVDARRYAKGRVAAAPPTG